ncbi:Lsr2 family DNA-binding protein [Nocardia sp. NPDC055002]
MGRAKTSTDRLTAKTPASAPIRRNDLTDIRAWASKNGHTVSPRGRISTEVIAACEAASA